MTNSAIAATRAAVVAEARSWIGTPYHLGADVKGAGVDCAMILVRVFCDLGLVAPFDPRPYSNDWHLHRGEEVYLGLLLARSREVARTESSPAMSSCFVTAAAFPMAASSHPRSRSP